MCNLCGTEEEQAKGKAESKRIARSLQSLAMSYHKMSIGELDPHGPEAAEVGREARQIIIDLVNDWV